MTRYSFSRLGLALVIAIAAFPAEGGDDPRGWLDRMGYALEYLNYEGTLVHVQGIDADVMRVVHRVDDGVPTERITAMDEVGREIIRRASGETLDLKAYEADMRHLIDTYIEADEPRKISPFDGMSLLDLIVKTGIAEAVAAQLGGLKGDREAVAETIENNVRSKIIREQMSDPAYYERMSALLDEIIAARKARALEYEEYLQRVAELTRKVVAGRTEETPEPLKKSPALRALYNNLKKPGGETAGGDPALELAVRLDAAVHRVRPDGWRGVETRERVIQEAMFEILHDEAEVERLFLIVKEQGEY